MEHESDRLLSSTLASLSKGRQKIFAHIGLWIAFLALLVATVVTFAEVSLLSLSARSLTLKMGVYAAVTVVMFLSLEEEGERAARTEDGHTDAERDLLAVQKKITPVLYGPLESFCHRYAEEELAQRRAHFLLSQGVLEDGEALPRTVKRRLGHLRPISLCAATLLQNGGFGISSPLRNPGRRRKCRLLTKLIPSLLCMVFGIGIAIGAREPLTVSAVLEGFFKLAALLIVALRGYALGYLFIGDAEIPFIQAKARLLERFLCEQEI